MSLENNPDPKPPKVPPTSPSQPPDRREPEATAPGRVEDLALPTRPKLVPASSEVQQKAREALEYLLQLLPFAEQDRALLRENFPKEIQVASSQNSFFRTDDSGAPCVIAISNLCEGKQVEIHLFHEIGHYIREMIRPTNADVSMDADLIRAKSRYDFWKRYLGPLAAPWKREFEKQYEKAQSRNVEASEFFAIMCEQIHDSREFDRAFLKADTDLASSGLEPSSKNFLQFFQYSLDNRYCTARYRENRTSLRQLADAIDDIDKEQKAHPTFSLTQLSESVQELQRILEGAEAGGAGLAPIVAFAKAQENRFKRYLDRTESCPSWGEECLNALELLRRALKVCPDNERVVVDVAKTVSKAMKLCVLQEVARREELFDAHASQAKWKVTYENASAAAGGSLGRKFLIAHSYSLLLDFFRKPSQQICEEIRESLVVDGHEDEMRLWEAFASADLELRKRERIFDRLLKGFGW